MNVADPKCSLCLNGTFGATVCGVCIAKIKAERQALDDINCMVSAPEWGVGMLEDICEVVRRVRDVDPDGEWERH